MPGALNQLVGESPMNPRYRDTQLKLIGTSVLSCLGICEQNGCVLILLWLESFKWVSRLQVWEYWNRDICWRS